MPDSEKKLKRVVIKEELVALTGDWLKALVLNQLLYWGQRAKDFDAFILEERLRKDNPDLELTHGWIFKSAREFADEIMVTPFSPDTVRRRLADLVEAGWISERNNPKHKWDRTLQYRPNIREIQRALQELGYALDGYPLLNGGQVPPQGADPIPQGAESYSDGADSNPDSAEALPKIPPETTPEREQPSLREQAKTGKMDVETEINLLAGFGRQGRAGVADPSQDLERFMEYGNEFVEIYHQRTGLRPEKRVKKPAIMQLAADPNADLEFWDRVVTEWVKHDFKPGNVAGMIDCYSRRKIPGETEKNGPAHRAPSAPATPGPLPDFVTS